MPFPLSSISFGPLGQSLDSTIVLEAIASIKTQPGSSHKDDNMKHSAFLKYLNILSLKPIR